MDILLNWLRIAFREAQAIAVATLSQTQRFITLLVAAARPYFGRRALRRAREALGQGIFDRTGGDPRLREQIADVDDRIESLIASGNSTRSLIAERRGLFIRLASGARSNDVPAECQKEYSSAIEAAIALEGHKNNLQLRKETLFPADRLDLARSAIGYVLAAGLLLLLMPNSTEREFVSGIRDTNHLERAIGFVVCGDRISLRNGKSIELPGPCGTCFAISSDGYFLTNNHVVEYIDDAKYELARKDLKERSGATANPTVWVFLGRRRKYVADVVYANRQFDLAILKVDVDGLPVFRMSDSSNHPRATDVYAYGFPEAATIPLSFAESLDDGRHVHREVETWFKNRDFQFSQTKGTVSRVTSDELTGQVHVQHDASINPGNSGGPLMLENGLVVGINTLRSPNGNGISFALSLGQLKNEISRHVRMARWE